MFYAGVSLGPATVPHRGHAHLFSHPCPHPPMSTRPQDPARQREGHAPLPDGDALCLPQTAFSDFLMGSSKDLAKHIRVVVSRLCPQAGWVGLA